MTQGKAIQKIEATHRNGKYYSWSADYLLWDELPKSLLRGIEMELPDYQIMVTYKEA